MEFDYTSVAPVKTFGGPDIMHKDSFLLSQCQHVLADDDVIIVSMLLNRNLRALDSSTGTFKCDISEMGFMDSEFEMAAGMCFYGGNQILVTDLNANKIMALNRSDLSFNGLLLSEFVFDKPNCIRTDTSGNIYVGEVGDDSRKLRCFDQELQERYAISQAGGYDLLGVNYISYDKDRGRILLTDSVANSVHSYDSMGNYQFSIACSTGDDLGEFTYPTGTCVDRMGNILVCDTGNSRVQVFDQDGKFLSIFGGDESFVSPMDIHVTEENDVVIVDGSVMVGWSRVQVFKY